MVLWCCPVCREEYKPGRAVQRRCCLDQIGRAVPIIAVEGHWEADGVSTRVAWSEMDEPEPDSPWAV